MKAITRSCWKRSMTEVYLEASELREAMVRLRPHWMLRHPNLESYHALESDWRHSWWTRARKDVRAESRRISALGGARLDRARLETRDKQQSYRETRTTFDDIDLDGQRVTFTREIPGWGGEPFEPWRANGLQIWWEQLNSKLPNSPYRDWLGPWISVGIVSGNFASWVHLWLYELDAASMPMHWTRWAMDEVQATRKWTDGSPVDNQISAYLVHCDHFVSADKAFVKCADKVRRHSPVKLAVGHLIPARQDLFRDSLLEVLDTAAP